MALRMPTQIDVSGVARRLLAHIDGRTTDQVETTMAIDPAIFTDEALAERERKLIFGRMPLVAAHGSELPNPNDHYVTQMANNEVLLVRQGDGSVRAFVNACRHRGARLVEGGQGSARVLACRYHGWTYDTDGGLRSITHQNTFGDVDTACSGLVQLPCEERHGFVFVVDDPEGSIDLAEWLGPELDESIGSFGLDRYTCYRVGRFDADVNWKAMVDGQIDTYHISFLHAKTVAPYVLNNVAEWEPLGRHGGRKFSARKTLDKYRDQINDPVAASRYVNVSHLVLPTTQVLRMPDHFQLLTIIPDTWDVGKSRMEIRLLIPDPNPSEEARELWDRNWDILMDVIRDEDIDVNKQLQHAVRSRHVGPLVLGRNEVVNQLFHRFARDAAAGLDV